MSIETKIKELLERASAAAMPPEAMHTLDGTPPGGAGGDLGSTNVGVAAAAAASKTGLPVGNNSNGDSAPIKQGSSESGDPAKDEEKLDDAAPGKSASANAGKTGLPVGNNNGGDSSPPAQGSSGIATPGQGTPKTIISDGKFTPEETEAITKVMTEAGIPAEAVSTLIEMFQKAVMERVATELDATGDSLVEAVETLTAKNAAQLAEDVNAYMSYVAEQWMEENALAIEKGLRTELAEDFIAGLHTLFKEHFVSVPDEQYDVLEATLAQVADLEAKLNESLAAQVELAATNRSLERRQIVEQATRGMVAIDADKFVKLVEDVEFDTAEGFTDKVASLKERYYPKTSGKTTDPTDTLEEGAVNLPDSGSPMSAYVKAISNSVKV